MARYKKITQPVGPDKKVKIVRALNPMQYKTAQSGPAVRFGQAVQYSKHDPRISPGDPTKVVRRKGKVRRLHVVDPYNLNSVSGIRATGATAATFSSEAETFTNNPNPRYDPSAQPPAQPPELTVRNVTMEKPGKAGRGHQKVVKRTLFNQNQGKRLRRV